MKIGMHLDTRTQGGAGDFRRLGLLDYLAYREVDSTRMLAMKKRGRDPYLVGH